MIAVFHTDAGHVTLRDEAYNGDRNIATVNPYRKLDTDLMEKGVLVELCGLTARFHGWGNADTIPGVRINTDAIARTSRLVHDRFVWISES